MQALASQSATQALNLETSTRLSSLCDLMKTYIVLHDPPHVPTCKLSIAVNGQLRVESANAQAVRSEHLIVLRRRAFQGSFTALQQTSPFHFALRVSVDRVALLSNAELCTLLCDDPAVGESVNRVALMQNLRSHPRFKSLLLPIVPPAVFFQECTRRKQWTSLVTQSPKDRRLWRSREQTMLHMIVDALQQLQLLMQTLELMHTQNRWTIARIVPFVTLIVDAHVVLFFACNRTVLR